MSRKIIYILVTLFLLSGLVSAEKWVDLAQVGDGAGTEGDPYRWTQVTSTNIDITNGETVHFRGTYTGLLVLSSTLVGVQPLIFDQWSGEAEIDVLQANFQSADRDCNITFREWHFNARPLTSSDDTLNINGADLISFDTCTVTAGFVDEGSINSGDLAPYYYENQSAITTGGTADDITWLNCTFVGGGNHLRIDSGSSRMEVDGCDMSGVADNGIQVSGATGTTDCSIHDSTFRLQESYKNPISLDGTWDNYDPTLDDILVQDTTGAVGTFHTHIAGTTRMFATDSANLPGSASTLDTDPWRVTIDITATADAGANTTVSVANHRMANTDNVVISGTTTITPGTYAVSNVFANTFEIVFGTFTGSETGSAGCSVMSPTDGDNAHVDYISMESDPTNISIYNNFFFDPGDNAGNAAIKLGDSGTGEPTNIFIYNNVYYLETGNAEIYFCAIEACVNVNIYNNTADGTGVSFARGGIRVFNVAGLGAELHLWNNLFTGSSTNPVVHGDLDDHLSNLFSDDNPDYTLDATESYGVDDSWLWTDLFNDAAARDYTLDPASILAIDQGQATVNSINSPTFDILNNPRDDGNIDIGAYEFQGSGGIPIPIVQYYLNLLRQ